MRFYGIKLKKRKEKLEFYVTKIKLFILQFIALNKDSKEQKKFWYNQLFNHRTKIRLENCSIPEGKYYIPICFVTSDLILRENISDLQSGLIKLTKHQYSHKFFGGLQVGDEIISNIGNMDNILGYWYNSVSADRFDFENNRQLKHLISYFDIVIKNVNSSYLLIEFYIYPSEEFVNSLRHIIDNDFEDKRGYVIHTFTRKGKMCGGKQVPTICHYANSSLKSDLLFENTSILKWEFYNEIQKYFPTLIHNKKLIPPAIEIYKTNISYNDNSVKNFWRSVGVFGNKGQFIDCNKKLFFETSRSERYNNQDDPDLVYIVNDQTIDKYPDMSINSEIVEEVAEDFGTAVLKLKTLYVLNGLAAHICIEYRQKLNKIKLRKNRFSKLLKLRYCYEKAIDFYKRYISDDIWKESEQRIATVFSHKRSSSPLYYDYSAITKSPLISQEKIQRQITMLEREFDNKTAILQHLSDYKNEKKNRKINIVMLVLSLATVTFIVFPDLSKDVSSWLINFWNTLNHFLMH